MKKLFCLLACLLLALCCCGAVAEEACEHLNTNWDVGFQYDADGHWTICADCGEKNPYENCGPHEAVCWLDTCLVCGAPCTSDTVAHYNGGAVQYITDATSHWYVCSKCGVTTDPEAHWIGCWNADNTHCLTCGAECEPNHNWEVTSETEATCTTDGVTEYTCSSCDETKTETTPATGHVMNDPVVVDPTCTEDGTSTATCATCGEEVVETLPATGHSFEDGGKTEPTCTEEGYQRGVCITCGETLDEPIPATGHTWEENERLDATCETDCKTMNICARCGQVEEKITDKSEHRYVTYPVAATCTNPGYQVKECEVCGDRQITDIVPALSHSYEARTLAEILPFSFSAGKHMS